MEKEELERRLFPVRILTVCVCWQVPKMWKGKALILDGLRPLFLTVYASKIVGWVSVPGAGRILCEKKGLCCISHLQR